MTKKDIIVAAANELFLKHGFKKISVDEICKKAGLSRKTYYTYFKNKDELVKHILNGIADDGFQLFDEISNDNSLNFADKLQKITLAKIEISKKWSLSFYADLVQLQGTELFNFYKELTEQSFTVTYNFLRTAQEKGEISPNLNLNYTMWLLHKQMEHMNEPELLKMFDSIEALTQQMVQVFVYGLLTPSRK